MVNQGPFMELLNLNITTSAANTFTEGEFATPASKTENMAMLIHKISYKHPITDTPADSDQSSAQITNKSQSAILNYDDSDVIDQSHKQFQVLTSGGGYHQKREDTYFDPPLLYAKSKIYIGFITNGMSGTERLSAKIGYTLEKVSKQAFIDALVE